MRDERGESVGVSGVPTPLAALFICSCFLCFVKTRRRKFWDVPLLYLLYIYGHIYQVLLYTRADTSSSSGSNTAAVDYQLRTDYTYICCCCTYSYYGQFARTLLGTATYVRITAAARSSSSGSRSSNPLNCIIMLVFT